MTTQADGSFMFMQELNKKVLRLNKPPAEMLTLNGMWSLPVTSQPPFLGGSMPSALSWSVSPSICLALPPTALTLCLSHLAHPAGPGSAPPPTLLAQILPSVELPRGRLNQVAAPTQLVQHDPEGSGWQHRPGRERHSPHPRSIGKGQDEVRWP